MTLNECLVHIKMVPKFKMEVWSTQKAEESKLIGSTTSSLLFDYFILKMQMEKTVFPFHPTVFLIQQVSC